MAIAPVRAQDKQPITIGFGMGLTGGLAAAGKSALLAMQIWQEDVNAKGGLMGRPVKLIYYDDQSNPATVPALYTKLLDVDKVDFIVSGYGTNLIAPAMPVAIQHDRMFFGLFGLAVNTEFHYPKYFSMLPAGPDPKHSFSEPFFKIALAANPKPKKLALLAEDSEFPKNASEGIRDIAKKEGLEIVYDKTYPPGTPDFTPIVHAIQATNPEMVFVASYPPGSAGMLRAATESGLKTRFFGGGMVGLQYTPFKLQFGPKLNGIVDYDWWIPAPTMQFSGILDFLKKYQAKAGEAGVDPLGWYLPPFAYAYLQVLGDAVEATKTLDNAKIADYMHKTEFKTIVGDISFGPDGEWTKPRVLEVQWQGIKGNSLDDFKDTKSEAILTPDDYKTGAVQEPYDGAQ
ncbi:MAG: amino acid ABC transporter substrate-binding protein [Alphaproteobacteria bacterium]|nr:amino acid ABC transporter substrate-binding protein [Alphaproteobacteria bacterium]MBV9554153.1 amino acid ABC transporter substrate-binding protein [Alphaproteobacteria bacterium]